MVFHSLGLMEELSTGTLWRGTAARPDDKSEVVKRVNRCRLLACLLAFWTVATVLAPVPAMAGPPGLLRPVPGELVRAFDAPAGPYSAGHRGADLLAPPGTAVLAAADGVVAFVGVVAGRPTVSIDHSTGGDSWRTTYQPVHGTVRAGQRVSRGDRIGWTTASQECASGCLHWGLRRGHDEYLDPMAWLSADGVRLLPADARPAEAVGTAPAGLMAMLRSQPMPASSSGLVRPVSGPTTSPFGMRLHPVLHVWKLHDGMDFGVPCGTPVGSAAAGRVVLVEHNIAYGLRVIVDHGTVGGRSIRTSYNHLSSTNVGMGQAVTQRQAIGAVGSTGYSTGCHLHLMTWVNGAITNPAAVVG